MEILYTYIKNIGYYAVLSSLVKMLAPEGGFKGYINMILGLVFMLIMLNPISAFLKTRLPELKDYIMREGADIGAELFASDDDNREIVLNEYNELARERILTLCEGSVKEASVSMETADDFSVKAIYIEGKLTGDGEKLKTVINSIFGCGEDNIFIYTKEE